MVFFALYDYKFTEKFSTRLCVCATRFSVNSTFSKFVDVFVFCSFANFFVVLFRMQDPAKHNFVSKTEFELLKNELMILHKTQASHSAMIKKHEIALASVQQSLMSIASQIGTICDFKTVSTECNNDFKTVPTNVQQYCIEQSHTSLNTQSFDVCNLQPKTDALLEHENTVIRKRKPDNLSAEKTQIKSARCQSSNDQFMLISYHDGGLRKVGVVKFLNWVDEKRKKFIAQWFVLRKTKIRKNGVFVEKLYGVVEKKKPFSGKFKIKDIITKDNVVQNFMVTEIALRKLFECEVECAPLGKKVFLPWKYTSLEDIKVACAEIANVGRVGMCYLDFQKKNS